MTDLVQTLNREQKRILDAIRQSRTTSSLSAADDALVRLNDWLLDDEQKAALTQDNWNVFFLYASAYLCDVSEDERIHDIPSGLWTHPGIPPETGTQIITRICRYAATVNAETPSGDPSGQVNLGSSLINTPLLGACLRLSKALGLKSPATIKDIAARMVSGDTPSAVDLAGSFEVQGVGPHPYQAATILVQITCADADVHRALKHHENAFQEELRHFNQRLRPRFLFSNLLFEITPSGYQPIDLKFGVDSSAALGLFMGNRLYTDKRVFLRELIQNAVDACTLRKLGGNGYQPLIEVVFGQGIRTLTVRDNGIGMDRQWVEKYFLSVGISFYQANEIQDINRDTRTEIGFISQFGIGFLSSFMVADKIVIRTRKQNRPGLEITITSLKDYFDVHPLGTDLPVGTQVTLHLKKSAINFCRSLEYVGYLKTNIRFLQIPIQLMDEQRRSFQIGNEPLSYAAVKKAPTDFVAQLNFCASEGYLYLGTKTNTNGIFALATATGGVAVFQDGIFVTQEESLLPESAGQSVIGRINLKGQDKCELSMDRNRIFWNADQKKQLRLLLLQGLAEIANRVVDMLDKQRSPANTRDSVINHLAIFFDFSSVDDALYQHLCPPIRRIVNKRFRDFIRINFSHTRRAEGIPEADGYNEHWQREIIDAFAPPN